MRLIAADQLMAYRYEGFWRPMDTLRDRQVLEDLVDQGVMPWRMPSPSDPVLNAKDSYRAFP